MLTRVGCFLVAGFIAAAGVWQSSARAAPMFLAAIDAQRDVLVRIDPLTGATSDVGPLTQDLGTALDLATDGAGTLFALVDDPGNVRLYNIDAATGAVTHTRTLSAGGTNIGRGESIFYADGAVYVAYASANNATQSAMLGEPDANGVLTNNVALAGDSNFPATCAGTPCTIDADGAGTDQQGNVFTTDRNPNTFVLLNEVDPISGNLTLVRQFGDFAPANDIVGIGDDLFMMDSVGKQLWRYDRSADSLTGPTTIDSDNPLYGLTRLPATVPEPSFAAFAGFGAVWLAHSARRRRRQRLGDVGGI